MDQHRDPQDELLDRSRLAGPRSLICFGNKAHGRILAEAAGTIFNPICDQCISRTVDGELVGGVTYQGYTGASIQLHMAGFIDNWANRDMLWAGFDYPFNQLGCRKVFGQVPASNTKALEIDLRLGFKIIATIDDVFPDGACHVLALAREDCRWLNMKPRGLIPGAKRQDGR